MVDHTSEKLKHVAFSVIIAVAVLTALGSVIISSVSTEGFEINEATLKKGSNTDAVLLVSVKNLGNSQIENISVTIDGLSFTGPDIVTPVAGSTTPGTIIEANGIATVIAATTQITSVKYRIQTLLLDVGDIASAVGQIPNSKSMLAGSSYTITVEATITGGTTQTFQTAVVHVTRI